MNPFINPRKRSVTLPKGCKGLVDVLEGPERERKGAIKRFIRLVLMQAEQDHAAELIIASTVGEVTPIRFRVGTNWYDLSAAPAHIRPEVVAEIMRMAQLPEGPFPKEGIFSLVFGNVQMRWKVRIKDLEGNCELMRWTG